MRKASNHFAASGRAFHQIGRTGVTQPGTHVADAGYDAPHGLYGTNAHPHHNQYADNDDDDCINKAESQLL